MYRPVLLTATAIAGLAAGSLIAQGRDTRVPRAPAVSQAQHVHAPARIDDALAAAVIRTVSDQFDTNDVTVQLGRMEVTPLSARDRGLHGNGRLRLDGGAQWIPFQFTALFDTELSEVSGTQLRLAGSGPARAADAGLARALSERMGRALKAEFPSQPVEWTQQVARVSGEDARFVHISGNGLVDFGAEGQVDAALEALYDRSTGRWLRVSYELGPSAGDARTGAAVASL